MSAKGNRKHQASRNNGKRFVCFYCGVKLRRNDPATTVDHIIPRSEGGPNTAWNRVLSCVPCNWEKRSRTFEEFTGLSELPEWMPWRTTQDFWNEMNKVKPPAFLP